MPETEILVNETVDGQPVGAATDGIAPSPPPEPRRRRQAPAKTSGAGAPNKPDKYIWGIYLFLVLVSIIEVYSASSTEIKTENVYSPLWGHIKFLVVGFVLVYLIQKVHYKFFRNLTWPIAVICLGLVVYASMFGVRLNDAMRAIPIGGMTIQPAEMLKLALVLVLAKIMQKNQISGGVSTKGVVWSAIVVAVFGLAVYQNGFTNMALMMVVSLAMFIIGGTQFRKIGIVVLCYCVLFGGYLMVKSRASQTNEFDRVQAEEQMSQQQAYQGYGPHFQVNHSDDGSVDRTDMRKERIRIWLKGVHPGEPVNDANYQVKHAHYAMAHGGITGNMPGNSRESARLPLAFSDYIFSIIVEDWGLVGGIVLLVFYLLLVARAGVVASKCRRAYPALLIMGLAVMIAAQALVHMGIVTGVMPVSGQPLPLISKGGTSILIMSVAFGMMLSVSRFAVHSNDKAAIRAETRDLPEEMQTVNPLLVDKP